jgi:hypothetical protein
MRLGIFVWSVIEACYTDSARRYAPALTLNRCDLICDPLIDRIVEFGQRRVIYHGKFERRREAWQYRARFVLGDLRDTFVSQKPGHGLLSEAGFLARDPEIVEMLRRLLRHTDA